MFGVCFATLTFPRVPAARAGGAGQHVAAAGSPRCHRHLVPARLALSSPSSTGRGTAGLGRFKSLCPFWSGDTDPASPGQAEPQTGIDMGTQRLRGCQVTLAQPHLSPKTGGQLPQRGTFQPKVPNSSCHREPLATSPLVPQGWGTKILPNLPAPGRIGNMAGTQEG